MKKRLFTLGILAIALIFGMTIISCDDGGGGGDDGDWINVTSLSQINGTWKGSIIRQEDDTDEGFYFQEMEVTINVNASAKTVTMSQKNIMTFSGSGSDTEWENMKTAYTTEGTFTGPGDSTYTVTKNSDNTYTVTGTDPIDNSPYTLTVEIDESAHKIAITPYQQPMTNVTDAQVAYMGLKISKDGRKLKSPGDEMIFYKQ